MARGVWKDVERLYSYVLKLLKLDNGYEATPTADNGEWIKAMQQAALILLDKKFCSGCPSAKSPGTLFIHDRS